MASVFRVNLANFVCNKFSTRLCKVSRNSNVIQAAFLSGKERRVETIKPPPFPYWKKKYGLLAEIFDPMTYRIDENSKIIVVDGPPASGKSKLCAALAEKLDFLYMPAPTYDDLYIDLEGVDLRCINKELQLENQLLDLEIFHRRPEYPRVATIQFDFFYMRYEQYLNALLHLLSTGQGVVLNRSVYSDPVFLNTMLKCGHISKPDYKYCNTIFNRAMPHLLRPNVVIYLDVPVKKVMENIKQRGIPYEVESKVFNEEYFKTLEMQYKDEFLKSIMTHSFVLSFDWSKEGNIQSLVTELESLPLDKLETGGKQSDWIFSATSELQWHRKLYHQDRSDLYNDLEIDCILAPDNFWEPVSRVAAQYEATLKVLGEDYADGYRPVKDQHNYTKFDIDDMFYVRRSPRDFKYRTVGPAE